MVAGVAWDMEDWNRSNMEKNRPSLCLHPIAKDGNRDVLCCDSFHHHSPDLWFSGMYLDALRSGKCHPIILINGNRDGDMHLSVLVDSSG